MKPPEEPAIAKKPSLFARVKVHVIFLVIRIFMSLASSHRTRQNRHVPPDQKVTLTKSYPALPSREVRIFIPSGYKAGDGPLPLIIDIHGGGFCVGAPIFDDRDNMILAYTHGFCVISIPYRLAPARKYPSQRKDCAAMIAAVLADESLPIDHTRVAVVGYSAGGNLALTSVMDPEVKGKIKAVVAYYPAVNLAMPRAHKIARQTLAPDGKDLLHRSSSWFNTAYIPSGTNLADPNLSPIFAAREDLPEKICLLGCEYDMLCREAEDMANDLAESETGEKAPLGGERTGWTKGNIRWELLQGMKHGFNQINIDHAGPEGEKLRARTSEMHAGVAEWLKNEVFA